MEEQIAGITVIAHRGLVHGVVIMAIAVLGTRDGQTQVMDAMVYLAVKPNMNAP